MSDESTEQKDKTEMNGSLLLPSNNQLQDINKTNPSGKTKILIAEDEKAISSVLSIKLSTSGFEVDLANNGKEAMDLLDKNNYDVVLLDLIMPIANGFDVLEHIQKIGKKMPVLVSSNLSQEEDINKAKKLGATDYFVKSNMTLSEIVSFINKYKK